MVWNWNTDSPVFDNVGWLQALWASRRTVRSNPSLLFPFYFPFYLMPRFPCCLPRFVSFTGRDVEEVVNLGSLITDGVCE